MNSPQICLILLLFYRGAVASNPTDCVGSNVHVRLHRGLSWHTCSCERLLISSPSHPTESSEFECRQVELETASSLTPRRLSF